MVLTWFTACAVKMSTHFSSTGEDRVTIANALLSRHGGERRPIGDSPIPARYRFAYRLCAGQERDTPSVLTGRDSLMHPEKTREISWRLKTKALGNLEQRIRRLGNLLDRRFHAHHVRVGHWCKLRFLFEQVEEMRARHACELRKILDYDGFAHGIAHDGQDFSNPRIASDTAQSLETGKPRRV